MPASASYPEPVPSTEPTPTTSRLRTVTGSRWPRKCACGCGFQIPRDPEVRYVVDFGEQRPYPAYLLCHVWKGNLRPFNPATYDRYYIGPTFRDAGLNRPWQLNHSLRRTFGRTLFQRQVPVEKIAELLGHEDTRTRMRYLGINDDDKLAAMRVIDEVFG